MKTLSMTLLSVALTGCAMVSPSDLMKSGEKVSFTVEQTPQVTYRRLMEGARACFESRMEVQGDFFPDTQAGRVSTMLRMGPSFSTLFVASFTASGSGTKVDLVRHAVATRMTDNVQAWIGGDYTRCGLSG